MQMDPPENLTSLTPQQRLIHNERVKLTVSFLSRIGLICGLAGLLIPLFNHDRLGPGTLYLLVSLYVGVGIGLNVWAFRHIRRLI
jgi:hypothetical protein